jgi:glycosyltransferase involved in cell wall biosynthesis
VRILVVSNLYPPAIRGGYEIECAGVVSYLRDRGDDVRVITSTQGRAEQDEGSVVRVLPLLDHGLRARLTAPADAVAGARAMRNQIGRFRPDLAFVWNGASIPHAAIHVILSSGVPTVFRVCHQWFRGLFVEDRFMRHLPRDGYPAKHALGLLARAVNQHPSLRLDPLEGVPVAISWVSDFIRRVVIVPEGLAPVLERTINPATDRHGEFASVVRHESRTPLIVFLGRLTREKGSDVLIEAVGLMARDGLRPRVVIAGHGSRSDLARLRRVAELAGVTDLCEFAGQLDTAAIRELFGAATVLAIPSTWAEPFGLVLIEGALARVPLVASRVGGIPEILSEDDEILLVPPLDRAELAKALVRTIRLPEEAHARAARAHSRASTMSWESYASATGAFIDEAFGTLSSRSTPLMTNVRRRAT